MRQSPTWAISSSRATRRDALYSVAANVGALRIELLARANRMSDALALGDRLAAEHPGNPTIALIRAQILQTTDEWDKALAVTVEARHFDQENAELRNAQTVILMHLGRLDDALVVLGQSAALDPFDADAQLLRAEILDRMGQTDDAIAALDEVAARDPGNVKVSERRSALLLSAHRYVEALDTIELARAAGNETSGLLILRAQALLSLERYEEAFSCFESVLDAIPGAIEDLAGKVETAAQTLAIANRVSQARTLLERLDDRHGLSAVGQALIAELLRMASVPDKSLAHADIALASTQDIESRAQTLATKSMALISLGRSAEALEAVDEALAAFDGYLFGWMARSMALYGMERPAEALQVLDQHLAPAPDEWQDWLLAYRAGCLTAIGQHDEAIAVMRPRFNDFAAAGTVGDGPMMIRTNLGYVYIRQRRYTDALEMLEPARRDSPDEWDPWALNNLIVALMVESRGESDEVQPIAERELKLALAIPAAPDRRAVAAWSQFWLRRYEDALASVDAFHTMRKDPLLQIRMAMGLLMIGMGRIDRGEAEIRQVLTEASRLSDQLRAAEIRAYGQWVSSFLVEGRRLAQFPDVLGNAGVTMQSGG